MLEVNWSTPDGTMHPAPKSVELRPLHRIIAEVAEARRLAVKHLLSRRRSRPIAHARQEAYWRCYNETPASLPEIGRAFGRDHSTVYHGIAAHAKRLGAGANDAA